MKLSIQKYLGGFAALMLVSSAVVAQTPADEFDRTQVLDKQRYSLTGRFVFDGGLTFLPLDAYYKPILLEGALSFQPFDWLAIELIRFGWSVHNYDTGLTNAIERKVSADTGTPYTLNSDQELNDMRYRVGSAVYFNLLYSKSNWFNQAVVYHYWQAGVGGYYYDMKTKKQVAAELALRARFFINNHILLNIYGGHSFGFKSEAPRNIMSLGAGVGFAF